MPVDPTADVEISAFRWVPPFAQGLVRDLRIRWALEEIGRPYRVRLLDAMNPRPAEYFEEQPWGQVPIYKDNDVELFESGAILIHLGLQDERLLPNEQASRMRAIAWTIAALNSVEPAILNLQFVKVFHQQVFKQGEEWARQGSPGAQDFVRLKLKGVSDCLGDKQWLEDDRFTIGDLMMVAVLRQLRGTGIIEEFPNIAALMERAQARPAFSKALADQLSVFEQAKEGAAA